MKAMRPDLFQQDMKRDGTTGTRGFHLSDFRRITGSETQRWRGTFMGSRNDDRGGTPPHASRIEQVCGKWFYQTREGTTEGPFETREAAQFSLDGYLLIAGSKAFDRHSLDTINSLSLEPLDDGKKK